MSRYLVFTLHAPMASFGGVAVGERRTGWDRPGRSAIIGLLAASLGIDRADDAAQIALDRGLGLALRTDATGRMLTDYHTAQVPPARRGRAYPTRAAELADPPLETILTRREYRTDALHMAAVWQTGDTAPSLEHLAEAIRRPVYTLFIGRKSCPLGLPLSPLIVEADNVVAAFTARTDAAPDVEKCVRQRLGASAGSVAMDASAAVGQDVVRVERRRDQVASRVRWQFALRDESILRSGKSAP